MTSPMVCKPTCCVWRYYVTILDFWLLSETSGVALCWSLERMRLLGTSALAPLFLTLKHHSCFIPFDRPHVAFSPDVLLTVDDVFNRPFSQQTFWQEIVGKNKGVNDTNEGSVPLCCSCAFWLIAWALLQ